ncbi:glycosyltransferase family 4 protein [Vibrio parahaemolyticus]|nr:glycosyltransferase family 4 protein [Vibrio parahaemolyticus]EHK2858841.1 glycosyltransferase family 4 protein [Vibrio parahaemolyticus]
MKIKIAYYSPSKGNGWKGHQVNEMIHALKKDGEFAGFLGISNGDKCDSINVREFRLPLKINNFIKKLSKITAIPSYVGYLIGEYLYGVMASRQLGSDYDVVICKPRPHSIVKKAKKAGKKIVLDYGEIHPKVMEKRLKEEYENYDIKNSYIYTNEYAINESLKSIEAADIIIVNSEYSKRTFLESGISESKLKKVNLLSGKNTVIKNSISEDDICFVTTAHHSFVKGTHRLIEVWKNIKSKNATLYIVGDLHKDMTEYLNKTDVPDNVKIVGRKNIEDFYKNKNIVGVSYSLAEGYSRVVEEFIRRGYPVVCTEVSTCDLIRNNENGIVVNIKNDTELMSNLERIINEPDIYASLKKGALETAKELNLSKKNYATDLVVTIRDEFDVS